MQIILSATHKSGKKGIGEKKKKKWFLGAHFRVPLGLSESKRENFEGK